ncbi:MAG: glycosyltransferase [Alphaproteobacteria bacterium]|nr:glycosyltransferase [Alphaproteobacteria bacterium]
MQWGDPGLNEIIGGAYLGLLTLVWAGLAAGVGRWGAEWHLGPDEPAPSITPLLSICIPARDEAGRIGPCVRAALASDYPELEVVVVDDRSSDGTGEEALAAADGDPRFRLVLGSEPPAGWAGKPWACQRASGEARGALLLFVDADVQLAPWAARAAVARLLRDQLAMLSLFGDWALESFWERAVIPVVGWFIRGAVDLDAANKVGRPEAFANGQFILVRGDSYAQVGGHEAVKSEVLDDVRLARAFKRRALPCGVLHAPGSFRVRLYTSLGEIVRGYTKNLYEGMDRRPLLGVGAVLFVFVSTLSPYLILLAAALTRLALGWHLLTWPWVAWLIGIVALIHLFRWRLERADGRGGAHALTHPLGNLIFTWILLRSVFGVESTWKGRRFVDGQAG